LCLSTLLHSEKNSKLKLANNMFAYIKNNRNILLYFLICFFYALSLSNMYLEFFVEKHFYTYSNEEKEPDPFDLSSYYKLFLYDR
jgi:hypothetical protein